MLSILSSSLLLLGFLAALALLGGAAARVLLPRARPFERGLAGVQFALVWTVVLTRVLGGLGLLFAPLLAGLTLAFALAAHRRVRPRAVPWTAPRAGLEALPLAVGALALGVALAAAGLLPIWQWDAAGYHLPFVNFALQAHSLAGVPDRVPYLSTYPHAAELAFLALRLFLPDDRWVDAGQLPFALLGALATAALARRLGARRVLAAGAGALWLGLPAVFTQLPTNYVDVAAAACLLTVTSWVLGPLTRGRAILGGLALGLYLSSKANAPPAALLLGALWVYRALRARRTAGLPVAFALALALGSGAYLTNLARFANPLWPARVQVGPLPLPGRASVSEILRSGQDPTARDVPLPLRTASSWLEPFATARFDMRSGGFGPLAPLLLAGAWLGLRRRARRVMWIPLVAAALGPDPSVPRFVLAVPALALALAAAAVSGLHPSLRRAAAVGAAGLGALGLLWAVPGLAWDGPTALRLARSSAQERERAFGPEGRIDAWARLRGSAAGRVIAYDGAFELPYLLWRSDLHNRVVRIPDGLDGPALAAWLAREHVTAVVAGDLRPAGALARARTDRFLPQFPCDTDACRVYALAEARR